MPEISYTTTQVGSITNFRYRVYVNGVELAPLMADDLKFVAFKPSMDGVSSAISGNTPIAYINKGDESSTLTVNILGFNKHQIKTALVEHIAVGSTATNPSTPFVGALRGISKVGRAIPVKIVAVLYYTDETGTDKAVSATDTTLPVNIFMKQAVLTEGGEMVFSTSKPFSYSITFSGVAQTDNDLEQFVIDDGISSSGTYTP